MESFSSMVSSVSKLEYMIFTPVSFSNPSSTSWGNIFSQVNSTSSLSESALTGTAAAVTVRAAHNAITNDFFMLSSSICYFNLYYFSITYFCFVEKSLFFPFTSLVVSVYTRSTARVNASIRVQSALISGVTPVFSCV